MTPTDAASSAALHADIAVVGAGPTGLTAALGAAEAGWTVALVAPVAARDPRTTALLQPAIRHLTALGVWSRVAGEAAPLVTMRLVDSTGRLPRAPEIVFDSHELGLEAFGYNIPNDILNAALRDRLAEAGVITVDAPADDFEDGPTPLVRAAGRTVVSRLVVAADGAQSLVRELAGLGVRRWTYDQAAFVTTLGHERPHGNTSVEFHTASGPFTLVPLPGNRSSLVWVARPEEAERWAKTDPGPLAREIERRSNAWLGRMTVDGPRGTVPLTGLIASRFGAGRVVLVGEAAHRFPPIGAQGLNLGMADAATLAALLADARRGGALADVPAAYDRRRRLEVSARTLSVDLLNRSLLTAMPPVTVGRAFALAAARNIAPLRNAMMRYGLGAG